MNNWQQFFDAQGSDIRRPLTVTDLTDGFVAPISDLGLIALEGDDAASFLHRQVTNDVEHLGQAEARLAGYCSPKGRLMATFLMWRQAGSIFLQLPRAIAAPLQKRLQMFVMRSKVTLSDASEQQLILGIGGLRAGVVLATWFDTLPDAPYGKLDHPLGTLMRVADACGAARYQWLMSAETAQSVWPALTAKLTGECTDTLAAGDDAAWQLSQVHAGVPQIDVITQEKFVPQMVNFELLGGVNFKKGCYPGQEIVARSQYLGKLKRRTTLVTIADGAAKAGDELFAASDPAQPCGMIVNAAPNGAGGVDALVEIKLTAIAEGSVTVGSNVDGGAAPVHFLPMPYLLDPLDL
ncbi:MAG: folate-binding protein YgfZ [Janthinobacterium sp.]|jgi:folate-binding protein YgfZ